MFGHWGDSFAAEDAAQEAVWAYLHARDRGADPPMEAVAWIIRVAYNRAVDAHRRRQKETLGDIGDGGSLSEERTQPPVLANGPAPAGSPPFDETVVSELESQAALTLCVNMLPSAPWRALLPLLAEGLDNATIADRLDWTMESVRSRTFRLRQFLKQHLSLDPTGTVVPRFSETNP